MTSPSKVKLPLADYSHLEPLPDPPREPDMEQHEHLVSSASILRLHFSDRDDVLIAGQGYLRREATNNREQLAPDCVIAFGVNAKAIISRNGYVISEVGKPPEFVLEVASRSTGRRDYTVKRDGYAGYGVQEYWRFDHTGGRFHDAALAGDLLVDGRYQPLEITEDPDGMKWGYSAVLGLDICWDNALLRFRNPVDGTFLPTPVEARDAEREARLTAEAELADLRQQLRRLQQD